MGTVLLGITGVMLFIGMALAGASYFGALASSSVTEARAQAPMQMIGSVAKAVSVRDLELETVTPSAIDASILVPDYLEELPRNPLSGDKVMLLTKTGTVNGPASIAAVYIQPRDEKMCAYIDRVGGGAGNSVPSFDGEFPEQVAGCIQVPTGSGLGPEGGFIGYAWIR